LMVAQSQCLLCKLANLILGHIDESSTRLTTQAR
jgi:hypothetical protein